MVHREDFAAENGLEVQSCAQEISSRFSLLLDQGGPQSRFGAAGMIGAFKLHKRPSPQRLSSSRCI